MTAIVAIAVVFSFALACGLPFAALGAFAALIFSLRRALLLASFGWLTNQVVGFELLGYPTDPTTLAWGLALGLSAVAAVFLASFVLRRWGSESAVFQTGFAFLAAWAAQQATVLVASFVLGGTVAAFAPSVVWFIFWTNALAFTVFLIFQLAGARAGVARQPLGQFAG